MTFSELSTPEDARVDLELENADLRAELADARRLHESEKRYLESIVAVLTSYLAAAEKERDEARAEIEHHWRHRESVAIARLAAAERVVEVAREMVKVARLDATAADEYVDALRAALAQGEEPAPRCERCGGTGKKYPILRTSIDCPACQGTGRGA